MAYTRKTPKRAPAGARIVTEKREKRAYTRKPKAGAQNGIQAPVNKITSMYSGTNTAGGGALPSLLYFYEDETRRYAALENRLNSVLAILEPGKSIAGSDVDNIKDSPSGQLGTLSQLNLQLSFRNSRVEEIISYLEGIVGIES